MSCLLASIASFARHSRFDLQPSQQKSPFDCSKPFVILRILSTAPLVTTPSHDEVFACLRFVFTGRFRFVSHFLFESEPKSNLVSLSYCSLFHPVTVLAAPDPSCKALEERGEKGIRKLLFTDKDSRIPQTEDELSNYCKYVVVDAVRLPVAPASCNKCQVSNNPYPFFFSSIPTATPAFTLAAPEKICTKVFVNTNAV